MSVKMRKHTERAQRSDLFMDESAEDFPANSKGGVLALSLKGEVVNLNALSVARSAGASKRQQGTAGRRRTRTSLRELVEAVVDTAQTASRERADIRGIFDLTGKDRSDLTLIATARLFATNAAPLVGLFVEFGLPPTFIGDLRAGADSLENYMSLQEAGLGEGVSTTVSAEETYQRIADLIERLDTVVRNKYRDNPVKLAAWERARRLEGAPHSKSDGNKTPPLSNNNN
jgi:hypothetical protein